MTPAITLWLAIVLAIGAITWFGTRRQAIAFTIISILAAPAVTLPLGYPTTSSPPAGAHTVLGVRIDIDKAIFVLLDAPGEPRYYRLPYSQAAANELQAAQDGTADGEGTVTMVIGSDGSPGFAEETTPPEPAKTAERAIIGG